MEYLLTGILLGITLTFVGAYVVQAVSHRINHGKKVIAGRREAGYVVPCRFNGSKKWYYVNEHGLISADYFYHKKTAVEACIEEYTKHRPKQTIVSRVA